MIQNGKQVFLEYTVFLEDGLPVDSNVGEEPLAIVVGKNQLFPALEREIVELKSGETKDILLDPEEAYGPVVQEAFKEVDLETVPAQFRQVGAILGVQDPNGGVYPIRVHDIKDTRAVLDFNHPLAGKKLRFAVKVLKIT